MILYHVASTYQLMCAMVHRYVYHRREKAVLIIADFLEEIYPNYRELTPCFFDEVFQFPYMRIGHSAGQIRENVINQYNWNVGYDISLFNKIYILGAQFYFTEFLISQKRKFSVFEEAAGMFSQSDRLEQIIAKKYPSQAEWAKKNGLLDLTNPLITEVFFLKRIQKKRCRKGINFDVVRELHESDADFRNQCVSFFLNKQYKGGINKSVLLTEHFTNLGIMTPYQQQFFYEKLVAKYCDDNSLIIKPHPSDTFDYVKIFPKAEIIREKFPAELLPFVFEKKPTSVMTMGSTAAYVLERYFDVKYIAGQEWTDVYLDEKNVYKFMVEEKNMENKSNHIQPAFAGNNVPIAISCSDEYVKYLSVLLQSIIDYSDESNNYDILILNKGIGERNQTLIKKQCESNNISVRFISTTEYIEGGNFYTKGLSIEAYFRMFLTDIMYNYDKTIYLDVDTHTLIDVAELFNIDIGQNYIAAAVDVNIVASYVAENHWKPYIDDVLKLDNPYEYVQSGVMLLNLKKLREDFSLEYLIEVSTSYDWRLYDQDVLNYLCKNNIYFLPPEYNVINIQEGRLQNIQKYAPENLKNEFFTAYDNPKIVHFVGKKKPWISFVTDYSECFWDKARKTPFYEQLLIGRISKIDLLDLRNQITQLKSSSVLQKDTKVVATANNSVSKINVPVQPRKYEFKGQVPSQTSTRALFRCQSVYQLLNAIVIKMTALKKVPADIILTKTTRFDDIVDRLKETQIFEEVIFSDDTPQVYLDWRGLSVDKQRDIWENPHKYICPIDISQNYTDYYVAVADEYNKIFYYYLLNKGNLLNVHFYEDGMNSYILSNIAGCKNDFINHEYFGEYSFAKNISEHYVYRPDVVVNVNDAIKYTAIDKIDSLTQKQKKILSNVFGNSILPTQKYIFLEEAFFEDGIASTDVELLDQIAEVVGKENIIVKLHPRNRIDRFSARGYAVMKNTTTPWEIVLLNSDISEKVFLTISSTAAMSAGLSFNKEFRAIYMYQVMTLGANIQVRQKGFTSLISNMKKQINGDRMQLMTPSCFDELMENLIYIEKGV